MTVSEIITKCRDRRKELNLTQTQLGAKLNLPKPRISEFENNKANLQLDTFIDLLNALDLKIN